MTSHGADYIASQDVSNSTEEVATLNTDNSLFNGAHDGKGPTGGVIRVSAEASNVATQADCASRGADDIASQDESNSREEVATSNTGDGLFNGAHEFDGMDATSTSNPVSRLRKMSIFLF